MRSRFHPLAPIAVAFSLAVAACGGGSGGDAPTMPSQEPPPPPPPPPEPPDSVFDTLEFQNNYGLGLINAIPAYEAGGTGQGMAVAVIDTGIDTDHPDLIANTSPFSTDVVARDGLGLEDRDGHGTLVAGVIAAERNGVGMHGVAFDSQIMAIRADDDASCEEACEFFDRDIAAGIDHAVASGAKVINLSLGGDGFGFFTRDAMQRAVAAGILVVIAAGNDGESQPDGFAQLALEPGIQGGALIVGATDRSMDRASFSNAAGGAASVFLVAPGVSILSTDVGGGLGRASGTSFSAPHVAGAAAVLFDLFPNLTGAEVAAILLETALDLGVTGVDAIFGAGLVDLGAAIEPIGPTSVPTSADGSAGAATEDSGAAGGSAFGDALAGAPALQDVLMLDRFDRGYRIDLGARVARQPGLALAALISQRQMLARGTLSLGAGARLFVSAHDNPFGRAHDGHSEMARAFDLDFDPVALFSAPLGGKANMAAAFGLSPARLLEENTRPAAARDLFLTSRRMDSIFLSPAGDGRAVKLGYRLSSAIRMDVALARNRLDGDRLHAFAPYRQDASSTLTLARLSYGLPGALWDLRLDVTVGAQREDNAFLGGRMSGALALTEDADSAFAAIAAAAPLPGGWLVFARYLEAVTEPAGTGSALVSKIGAIRSRSYAAGILGDGVFHRDDGVGISVLQPLRVYSGGADLTVPVGRDFASDTILFERRRLPLSPSGREIDVELAYRISPFDSLSLEANLVHQFDAGHVKGGPDATALALRASFRF